MAVGLPGNSKPAPHWALSTIPLGHGQWCTPPCPPGCHRAALLHGSACLTECCSHSPVLGAPQTSLRVTATTECSHSLNSPTTVRACRPLSELLCVGDPDQGLATGFAKPSSAPSPWRDGQREHSEGHQLRPTGGGSEARCPAHLAAAGGSGGSGCISTRQSLSRKSWSPGHQTVVRGKHKTSPTRRHHSSYVHPACLGPNVFEAEPQALP